MIKNIPSQSIYLEYDPGFYILCMNFTSFMLVARWLGQIKSRCIKINFISFSCSGQVFTTKLLSIKDQHRTAEGSPSDDDSYLGYSVATGEFNGDGNNVDVTVGMPRGANLNVKVRFTHCWWCWVKWGWVYC